MVEKISVFQEHICLSKEPGPYGASLQIPPVLKPEKDAHDLLLVE